MKTQLWSVLLVLISGAIGAFGPIYLKKGTNMIKSWDFHSMLKNRFLLMGILIYGISTLMFIPALKGGDLSVLYPLVGFAYIWVCIYSKFMLNENMTLLKWLGIAAIILGVSFIGIGA